MGGDARSERLRAVERRIRPFVALRVPPRDVDDVVQDVLLRVERGRDALREEARFGPWLYRIARNTITDYRRKSSRHAFVEAELEDVPAPAGEDDDAPSAARTLARAVGPFVARLPSHYRDAVTMTELEGIAHDEAARRLGISLAAMKSRALRGRARLRRLFEDCCRIALDSRGRITGCAPLPRREPICACL